MANDKGPFLCTSNLYYTFAFMHELQWCIIKKKIKASASVTIISYLCVCARIRIQFMIFIVVLVLVHRVW